MKPPSLFPKIRLLAALLLALICAGRGVAAAQDVAQFDAANKLYESGKFAEAKTAYERLVQSGPWSANLFYNLGNAEWKLGDAGLAALEYERALALQPSHPEARANLTFVQNQAGARVISRTWWEQSLGALNPSGATILAALCVWILIFGLAARMLRPEGGTAAGAVLLFIVVLAVAYAGGALWVNRLDAGKAIIVAKSTPARVAPAETAPAADVLPAGSEVLAPEERGLWTYGTLPSGTRAWVATEAVQRVALTPP